MNNELLHTLLYKEEQKNEKGANKTSFKIQLLWQEVFLNGCLTARFSVATVLQD